MAGGGSQESLKVQFVSAAGKPVVPPRVSSLCTAPHARAEGKHCVFGEGELEACGSTVLPKNEQDSVFLVGRTAPLRLGFFFK